MLPSSDGQKVPAHPKHIDSDSNVSSLASQLIEQVYSTYGISQSISDVILSELASTFESDQGRQKFRLLELFVRILSATDVQVSKKRPIM